VSGNVVADFGKNSPRVVHVITGLGAGGAQKSLVTLLSSLGSGAMSHLVVSLTEDGIYGSDLRQLGVEVACVGMNRGRPSVLGLRRLLRRATAWEPDVIQGWMYHGNVAATLTGSLLRKKTRVIWNIRHSLDSYSEEKRSLKIAIWLNKVLGESASTIIYNSWKSKHQHELFGMPSARSRVIANGFDPNTWKPSEQARIALRNELGIDRSAPIIGHVARLDPAKDHQCFFSAIRTIANVDPTVHFVLVGLGVDPQNPFVTLLAQGINTKRLHLMGERRDISRLMPGIDIFCLTSRTESFPNVLGEAMSCGLACVSTDVGDCRMLLGPSGIVVPCGDPQALSIALLEVLRLGSSGRELLGAGARERIQNLYSVDAMMRQYLALYTVRPQAAETG
jgi:glycosyltransferase involved in cell wall biosynthesis